MEIRTLIENTTERPDLEAEHGLSLYLEVGGKKILFDMGQSDAFARNAAALGIDLSQVDLAVLSHGHYDHGGGLKRFLTLNDHAPVYLSRWAFEPHWHGTERYIGLDPALVTEPRLIPVDGTVELGGGLTLLDGSGRELSFPLDPAGLTVWRDGAFLPEEFRHEIYLRLQRPEGDLLISGCSHRGILNILRWFRPRTLIGGFHFMKLDPAGPDRQTLDRAAEVLAEGDTVYYTGHCTGDAPFAYLQPRLPNRLHRIRTGTSLAL